MLTMIQIKRGIASLFLILVVFALGACAKKQETSTVSMHFDNWNDIRAKDIARRSKVSSLGAPEKADLHMVVVYVGDAAKNWNRRTDSEEPPTDFTFDGVPSGKVGAQVLALYETANGMEFYYGSGEAEVKPTQTSELSITVVNVAVDSNLKQGDFVGRFIPETGTPPTARVKYVFNPPGGKQMVVHQGEMFSGWMQLFSLSSSILSYSSDNAVANELLKSATIMNNNLFSASKPGRAMRIVVPAHSLNDSHDYGV
ncbi:MAG TPA: hypothetical protein VM432_09855, partial [Bdellovibrionales bacterium]|nr:hypothetical protein [Bdellovibrionales bacterium]